MQPGALRDACGAWVWTQLGSGCPWAGREPRPLDGHWPRWVRSEAPWGCERHGPADTWRLELSTHTVGLHRRFREPNGSGCLSWHCCCRTQRVTRPASRTSRAARPAAQLLPSGQRTPRISAGQRPFDPAHVLGSGDVRVDNRAGSCQHKLAPRGRGGVCSLSLLRTWV